MKIHEILTENVEVTEGLTDGLLAKMFGGVASKIAKGTKNVTRPLRARARLTAMKNRAFANSVSQIKADLKLIAATAMPFLKFLETLGYAGPLLNYYNQMQEYDEKLANGSITQEQYDQARHELLGIATTATIAMVVGKGLLKTSAGISSFFLGWIPGMKTIISGISKLAWPVIIYELNTDAGKAKLAEFLGDTIVVGTGDVSSRMIDYFKYLADKATGNAEPEPEKPAAPAEPDMADYLAKQNAPKNTVDPATDNFYSSQLERDPATGKLKYRDFKPVTF